MNGFRIVAAADNAPPSQSNRLARARAKSALALAVPLLLSMIAGCRKTPTYSGPPDTVITVLMKKWAIVPDRIEVPRGAKVELIVRTADVEHGFNVPALAINEPIQPNRPPVSIRFLAQTPGTYLMRCSIACGKGHDKMTGIIIITPSTSP
jgi:heme/copper-type cytochrome/quinol oxidase subunit 2